MNRGAFCISIDLELAWGAWDRPSAAYHRLCAENERAVVKALLVLLASREVPATWAIVGRLLDSSGQVPASSPFGNTIWYGPDLVGAIQNASPKHELGSHGFEHRFFHTLDRETIRADLRSARRVHQQHGLPFTSFVFPRNQVSHLVLLALVVIMVFRGIEAGWHMSARQLTGNLVGRAANLADKALPIPPAVVAPRSHQGLVELPSSMLLLGRTGLRRLVSPEAIALKAKLGLRRAARDRMLFHLWFHPSNFYVQTNTQLGILQRIVDHACSMRERGELEIRTMASFACA